MSYVSSFINSGVFGKGNSSYVDYPTNDPMYDVVSEVNLKWERFPQEVGYYRIHYMHCSGVWVDRIRIEQNPDTKRFTFEGNNVDTYDAEWMLIPDDFGMPSQKHFDKHKDMQEKV